MPPRRHQPLTPDNAQGNGTPAIPDLVAVQGFLYGALNDFRAEVRQMLRDGREDHRREHEELRDDIAGWRSEEVARCADRMAPYENVDKVFKILNWIGCHRKQAAAALTFVLTTIVAIAALAGGYFEAP